MQAKVELKACPRCGGAVNHHSDYPACMQCGWTDYSKKPSALLLGGSGLEARVNKRVQQNRSILDAEHWG